MSLPPNEQEQGSSVLPDPASRATNHLYLKHIISKPKSGMVLGLGIAALIVVGVWQARQPLAKTTLVGILRSQGIASDVSVENLQLGTTILRNLRLGPTSAPDLVIERVALTWRFDSKTRLIVIEQALVSGVRGKIKIKLDGALDFGSLTPLLKPSGGPKRTSINGLSLTDTVLRVDTAFGPMFAHLRASGGEATGWAARAEVFPPLSLVPVSNPKRGRKDIAQRPLILGFAAATRGTGSSARTEIGFAFRPDRNNVTWDEWSLWGLDGQILGQMDLGDGGRLTATAWPSRLRFERVESGAAQLGPGELRLQSLHWAHQTPWQRTGAGQVAVTGQVDQVLLVAPDIRAKQVRLQIGAKRDNSGQAALGYNLTANGLGGAVTGQSFTTRGRMDARSDDLTKLSSATLTGDNRSEAKAFVLPNFVAGLVADTAGGQNLPTLNANASLRLDGNLNTLNLRLIQPLSVRATNGARATLDNPIGTESLLTLARAKPDRASAQALSVRGAGRLGLSVPNRLIAQASLNTASWAKEGWSIDVGGLNATQILRTQNGASSVAKVVLQALTLNGSADGALIGQGIGRLEVTGKDSQAKLAAQFEVSPDAVVARLSGPFRGFGDQLGVGGNGVRDGQLNLDVQAQRQAKRTWVFSTQGRAGIGGLSGTKLVMSGGNLQLAANGATRPEGTTGTQIFARTIFKGNIDSLAPRQRGGAQALSGLNFALEGDATGDLENLRVLGNVSASAKDGVIGPTSLKDARAAIRFDSQWSASALTLSGNHALQLGQWRGGEAGKFAITSAKAQGPFSFQGKAAADGATGFWSGALAVAAGDTNNMLRTELDARLAGLLSGATQLTQVQLRAPVTLSSLAGQSQKWLATAQVDAAAQSLDSGETHLSGLVAQGQVQLDATGQGQFGLRADQCLSFKAQSGALPGNTALGPASGQICPNAVGQLAVIGAKQTQVLASTQLAPLALHIGDKTSGQNIQIGAITGGFSTSAGGNIKLAMTANAFALAFGLADGTQAQITAKQAQLDIEPSAKGIALRGQLGELDSPGLPVALSGGADTDLVIGPDGMSGFFNFDDIRISDLGASPRFGPVRLTGGGTLANNQLTILGEIFEPQSGFKIGDMTFSQDVAKGSGGLVIKAQDVILSPTPLQSKAGLDIVTLLPPLRGVVTDMVGAVTGVVNFDWAKGQDITSSAQLVTKGLDFSTLLGPVTGLSGDINLDDVLLARTKGAQTIKIGSLNTGGIPILDGTVLFALPGNNSLRLEDASWPFADGRLSVRPATWTFRDGDQGFAIDVEDVDLAKLLRLTEVPNLEIDGKVSGVFPIEVRQGNVEIVGGRLKARDGGGIIRYTGPNLAPPPPPPGFFARLRQSLFGKPPPQGADLAIEALRALEYKIFEITVDGRLSGELQLGIVLQGANQQVLSGQPFKFTIKMNVPLGQLIDNINRFNNTATSPEVLEELDRILKSEQAKPDAGLVSPSPQ